MGPAVWLREAGESNRLKVIDGSQRLATLSILCLAVLERLAQRKTDDDRQRYVVLKSQFIGAKDPASLHWASRLTLNENDDAFFQGTLVNHRQPPSVAKLRSSEQRLGNARTFFITKLAERFPPQTADEELVRFVRDAVARRPHQIPGNKPETNKDLERAPYETKKEELAASGSKLSAGITAADWTPSARCERQRQLSRVAAAVWRVEVPP
jgi:hypothetical protein